MKPKKFNRRDFLFLGSAFVASNILNACKGGWLPASLPAGENAIPPVDASHQVVLNGGYTDAWSWVKSIQGTLQDREDCQDITIVVNDRRFKAIREGGHFSALVIMPGGENDILAICNLPDGQELSSNMVTINQRLRAVPVAIIEFSLDEHKVILDGGSSQPSEASGSPLAAYSWSVRPGVPEPLTVLGMEGGDDHPFTGEERGKTITIEAPLTDGEYYLRLKVQDEQGKEDTSVNYFVVAEGQPRLPDYDRENPSWVETAVVYGVIPRNFGSPRSFQAIIDKLDYLADLGVNALWLAPITVSPGGDYGYAVVDYFELNPRYGTKEDFHRLVQQAHNRGIRVLMDFVPNHTSSEHPYFLDTLENGAQSPYWDFYDRDESGTYTHYFSWDNLPNLNYDNPEVVRWMMEAFSYWVREFDVDGFRVDVAWGIKQRKPDFWLRWRRELKRIKPDLLLLAEASARDPYYFDHGFDAAYDWTSELGQWAWELVWGSYKHRLLAYNLDVALTNRPTGFHPDALIFRFLNNNDTGDRFITTHGEAMTRVATALLLTLPGIPCIYTGDEVGEWFRPYYDPQPLTWKEDRYPGLRQYHQKLIALRKEIESLHSRFWTRLEIAPVPQEVYGYIRHAGNFALPVVVLLNFFEEQTEMVFKLPEEITSFAERGSLYDVLAEEEIPLEDRETLRIQVPGMTARILMREALK